MGLKNFIWIKKENPYSNCTKEELLDNYKSQNWNKLSNSKKMSLLQATGEMYSKEIGLEKNLAFEREHNQDCYGGYNGAEKVRINLEKCFNPYEALDTVLHEVNHAYQSQSIENNNGRYSEGERALLKAQNGRNYISYRESQTDYMRQSLEADSNNVGVDYLLKEKERYQDDAAYTEYLKGRYIYFEERGMDYQKNSYECDSVELRQVDRAAFDNEINVAERKVAEECIYREENSIRTKCLELQEEIKENFFECAVRQEEKKYIENNWNTEQKYEYAMNQAESRHQLFEERNNGIMKNQRVSEYLIDNYVAVRILENRKQELIEQRQNSMKELENRITSNNMNIPESRQDSECQRLAKEIERIEQKISNCDYRVAKLQTDNQIVSQETGIVIEEKQKNLSNEKNQEKSWSKTEEFEILEEKSKAKEEEIQEEELEKETEIQEEESLEDGLKEEAEIQEESLEDGLEEEVEIQEESLEDGLEEEAEIQEESLEDGLEQDNQIGQEIDSGSTSEYSGSMSSGESVDSGSSSTSESSMDGGME